MSDTEDLIHFTPGAVKEAMKGVSSGDLWKIPRDRIRIHPDFNVRDKNEEYHAQVRLIADSMKANGYNFGKPIEVFIAREDGESVIYLVDGHTRIDAFDLAVSEGADLKLVSAVQKPNGTSMEDVTASLITSNNGRNLSPLETARVIKRMIGYGSSEAEISRRFSFSVTHIKNLLDLLAAPRPVRDMVSSDKVSATLAVETLHKHGSDAHAVLQEGLENAKAKGKSKLTKKHLPQAPKKAQAGDANQTATKQVKIEKAAEKKNELAVRGLLWMRENNHSDPAMLELIAHMAEIEIKQLKKLDKTPD